MNIWIIDDNKALLELLMSSLEDMMWHLYTFSCGQEVLTFPYQPMSAPDVVILDWTLPDLPASIVLDHIKTHYQHVQIIVMSGNSDIEEQLPPSARWLGKPFRLTTFRQMVADVASSV
ncbi:response regulator [Sulfobacillus thermosulfidooxidans]|uniref:response regulator n=1 Tax=Sulfobacillus thermosulfidooxidans TaxID=28034 RepID=UPI00096B7354|nr:response regulator [Sulfobacillus thermosulfidooxidans]OLZ08420.1 hypothetical protein BFX05_04125 [Sulfobacillus thermosulfidooxidans]OLZ13859.1 hypothetical protein BFX06_05955 [Sulfobacillus thermosulfidooxidans]OLZ20477.1 hypothetical protein BFX07_14750 [Sulfobacillus thermosulfidooxidans]